MRRAHQSVLVLALVAITASVNAINKKSDESGMQPGNQPVYQAPGGPYSVPNHQYQQSQEHNAQANMQPGSQSNLYYYYYPVADKSKEGPYAHNANSPVNHASSAQHDGADHGSMDAAASGSEISYTSPEMNQMNQDYNQGSQGFDPSALNLAQQLNSNSGLYNFNGGPNNYDANAPNMGYGPQGDASSHMPTQVHPNYNGPMGPQGQMFSPGPYGGQHPFPNFGGQQAVQPQQNEVSGITAGLKKYGLSTILMPVLALAGLSLLLPTVTSLGTTTTKTKRSIDDSPISAYIEKMDNYYKLYNKAMEKEECMNRMICELGVVENLAPQWMEKKMTVFKSGALSKDMSKCKKYSC